MEVVSDTMVNGKRILVLKYTEEEKAAANLRMEQHKAEVEAKRKQRIEALNKLKQQQQASSSESELVQRTPKSVQKTTKTDKKKATKKTTKKKTSSSTKKKHG